MITTAEIVGLLDEAIKSFGEYQLHDKGASEVMDVDQIADKIKDMTAESATQVLEEVCDQKGENGEALVSEIISNLDDAESEWFDKILESEKLSQFY